VTTTRPDEGPRLGRLARLRRRRGSRATAVRGGSYRQARPDQDGSSAPAGDPGLCRTRSCHRCLGLLGLLRRIEVSPIVGCLLAGLAIGPQGFALLAPNKGMEFLSELGVVLLMFMVGSSSRCPR
jgi:hypothetical protein